MLFLWLYLLLQDGICIFIVSTYTDGSPTDDAKWFYKWLQDTSNDFRVQKSLLFGMKYSVFGLGNSLYTDHYNVVSTVRQLWVSPWWC